MVTRFGRISSLNIYMQQRPGQITDAKGQRRHSKADKHHLGKSPAERNLFGHRDVKAEQEDHNNSIENHQPHRHVDTVKDKVGKE